MKYNNWDKKKIEQLLSNAPKIIDYRSKEEVYERLWKEGVFNEEPSMKKIFKKINWVPYFVSIAAIFLCVLLIPSFLDGMKNDNQSVSTESKVVEKNDTQVATENEDTVETVSKTAFYEKDIEGNMYFIVGLVNEKGDSVPITISIPHKKILQDFGFYDPITTQLYEEYAPKINEEALGFVNYHPYLGEIDGFYNEYYGNEVTPIFYLPSNIEYDNSLSSFETFKNTLIDTFGHNFYEMIDFRNENGTPFTFKEKVNMKGPLELNGVLSRYNYFRYTAKNGKQYLVPRFRGSYISVEDALEGMKTEPDSIYESVIIEGVDYSCEENGNSVIVKFKSEVNLAEYDQIEAMQMIEGILLTAERFGKQVKFENVKPIYWQGFDFSKLLPVPYGPNKISIYEIQ